MSTDKNGPRRNTTKAKSISTNKPSTRKLISKEPTTSKKVHEEAAQKDPQIGKPAIEKELGKNAPRKNPSTVKAKGTTALRKTQDEKPSSRHKSAIYDSKSSVNNSKGALTKPKANNASTTSSASSRVSKSQYFPSKNLFSNALKSVEMQSKLVEEDIIDKSHATKNTEKIKPPTAKKPITITSIKNPKSVNAKPPRLKVLTSTSSKDVNKVTPRDSSPETSSTMERPRTATLRKGSIVNENIVGPEAPSHVKSEPAIIIKETVLEPGDDDKYADDFDSYESDFEAASSSTSSEDTNMAVISPGSCTSSSAEDVSENKLLPAIQNENKTAIRLSSAGTDGERKLDSGTFELSDFKHRQIIKYIEDTIKKEDAILEQNTNNLKEKVNHPSLSDEGFEDQKSLQFINFAHAKRECEKRRASAAKKKRGEELLGMIKLDAVNFTIFDSPSVSYEVYIANYGQGNSVQASAQTGDDDLSEEIQTDVIAKSARWTQMPNKFTSFDQNNQRNFWAQYKAEYIGAGEDGVFLNEAFKNDSIVQVNNNNNESRLTQFISNASQLLLQILSEATMSGIGGTLKNSQNNLPFSKGYLKFNTTTEEIFRNTIVHNLSIHPHNAQKCLTVHHNVTESKFVKSVLCIWDIGDLERPRSVLVSFGEVSCATFSLDSDKYVLAGQKDGSLVVWNVEERHKLYDMTSRTPSFLTPIGSSHVTKVVSVQPIILLDQRSLSLDAPENNEICSLDESGIIIIWTFYVNTDPTESISGIILINTQVISLQNIYPHLSDLTCSDCIVMDNHIYVLSSYGFVLHHLIKSNQMGIKMFVPETNIEATCLESCPFSPSYFATGYSNGDISLFSRATQRPLLVLQNKQQIDSAGIQLIRWSKTKPFVFYANDSKNTIHIWDLCKSDMYPEYSIPFPDKIRSIELSPVLNGEKEESPYMLIGTEKGELYLHVLNEEYGQECFEKYQEHVKVFFNYVNRL